MAAAMPGAINQNGAKWHSSELIVNYRVDWFWKGHHERSFNRMKNFPFTKLCAAIKTHSLPFYASLIFVSFFVASRVRIRWVVADFTAISWARSRCHVVTNIHIWSTPPHNFSHFTNFHNHSLETCTVPVGNKTTTEALFRLLIALCQKIGNHKQVTEFPRFRNWD